MAQSGKFKGSMRGFSTTRGSYKHNWKKGGMKRGGLTYRKGK